MEKRGREGGGGGKKEVQNQGRVSLLTQPIFYTGRLILPVHPEISRSLTSANRYLSVFDILSLVRIHEIIHLLFDLLQKDV